MMRALFRKQFKELGTMFVQNRKKGKRRSKAGTAGLIVLFGFAFLSIGFAFFGMGMFFAMNFIPMGLDWLYFAMMGMIALFLGVIGEVFATYSTLYNAKDNDLLLSMPIPPGKILLARMTSVFALGLIFEALAFVPAIIVYWINTAPTAATVIFPIVIMFVLAFLVLILSCALGWVVALVAAHVKSKAFTTVLLSLVLIAVYYVCYFRMNALLQSAVNNVESISRAMRSWLFPMYHMGRGASGNALSLLIFAAIVAALFAILYFVLSRSFIKIVTTHRGEKKAAGAKWEAKASSVQKTLFRKEMKHFTSSPAYMLNSGLGLIILPALAIFALIRMDQLRSIVAAADGVGIGAILPVFATAAICLVLAMNAITAPSISLEGHSLWILRSLPVNAWDALQSKQTLHIVLNAVPALISGVLIGIVLGADLLTIAYMLAFLFVFISFTSAVGLAANLKRPRFDWTNEAVPVKQSMSVLIVMLSGWGVALVLALGAYLTRKLIGADIYLIAGVIVVALAARLMNSWLRKKGTQLFDEL